MEIDFLLPGEVQRYLSGGIVASITESTGPYARNSSGVVVDKSERRTIII